MRLIFLIELNTMIKRCIEVLVVEGKGKEHPKPAATPLHNCEIKKLKWDHFGIMAWAHGVTQGLTLSTESNFYDIKHILY